ncbi:hypothetical protein GCM10023335_70110 [Streptomyces siamensis]|uniref:Uncharacterized protein n=1 Tax=Streptomyces siamensis TaxID=1274986 RepID=A0ABP9JGU8_9ACTN
MRLTLGRRPRSTAAARPSRHGSVRPGPSYLDAGSGVPAHGNQRAQWDAGCRPDAPNPDYR